ARPGLARRLRGARAARDRARVGQATRALAEAPARPLLGAVARASRPQGGDARGAGLNYLSSVAARTMPVMPSTSSDAPRKIHSHTAVSSGEMSTKTPARIPTMP